MRLRAAIVALCCVLGMAAEGRAQVAWDSPLLLPPRPEAGTGIYLMDAHRAGIGALGTWRGTPQGVGFRVGIAEGRADGVAILGGADFIFPLMAAGPDFPLDMSWLLGVGAGYDDWLLVSLPLGITLGRTFSDAGLAFTPYFSPRIILDAAFDRPPPQERSSLDLNFAFDLGFDLAFQPGWTLRLGASLGDRSGLAVGIRF